MKEACSKTLGLVAAIMLLLSLLTGCSSMQAEQSSGDGSTGTPDVQEETTEQGLSSDDLNAIEVDLKKQATSFGAKIPPHFKQVPLNASLAGKTVWRQQGTAGYWGTCGQTAIANTVNIVTGSTYSEADLVSMTSQGNHMQTDTGGMTVNDMLWAYRKLLPLQISARAYAYSKAPTLAGINSRLEKGSVLNVSVYGKMMREGGHTDEGDIYSDHWITLTSLAKDSAGTVVGYTVVDSASSITYLSCNQLDQLYHGHDGTTILDPTVIEIYGWEFIPA